MELKRRFLLAFTQTGNISAACKAAGPPFTVQKGKYKGSVNSDRVYRWLNTQRASRVGGAKLADPHFAAAFEQCREIIRDQIRSTWHQKALHGWEEPIIGRRNGADEIIGYKHVFSERLLMKLIDASLPEAHPKVDPTGGVHVHLNQQINNQNPVLTAESVGKSSRLLDDMSPAEKMALLQLQQARKARLDGEPIDGEVIEVKPNRKPAKKNELLTNDEKLRT